MSGFGVFVGQCLEVGERCQPLLVHLYARNVDGHVPLGADAGSGSGSDFDAGSDFGELNRRPCPPRRE
ncbi:hypothetical protein AB0E62_06400 [Streptomyces sp. NPDC038707]|uniref:hypothetical protein n=1 Tax=Streptomyces sp. NPDC038707 TaxID=3154329 RepID=UPI0033CCD306